ncbi:uncharacterized protein LOC127715641 isoform X5 [Mytilus californianus]|uniref:uncharacterized protein LOC127715641 isoform X5 n=1 Tax=Mytilus californianus TaxID=6549 RepID=UPI002247B294|nr:uncharacterized protein LOC127715641 isoform X5 [Mytilus californianus]XP_052077725.1 uncharacterized protein LOC127715641 isoform X5 [Mytilus californianus]
MGESLSKKWGQDPAYHEATETLTRSNKNTQQFVNKILAESSKLETKNKDLEKEIAKLKASIELKKTPRAKLNRGPSAEEQLLDGCLNEQQNLVEKNETLKQENIKLNKEIKVLSDEKESALSRLSKLAGIQLTKGNSDITDLSDSNRPTKLSEKWSSLYTDEWSEAFDELSKIKTNDNFRIEKELRDIVKKCYSTCVNIEKIQMVDIKKHTWDIACCLHHRPDQLVEAAQTTLYFKMEEDKKAATHVPNQKANATNCLKMTKVEENKKAATQVSNQKANAEDMLKLLAIQKCMEELIQIVHERRKYDKKLLEYVMQKTVKQFERYRKSGSPNHVINFVKRCTELCWSMVIKEPSMVLIYDQLEGKPIDKNLFSPYTKNGSVIDFVVWPALILHKTGPILQKGSVQGKDVPVLADTQQKTDSRMANSLAETSTDGSATFIVRDSTKGGDDIKVFIPPNGANQSVKMTDGGRNEQ